MCERPFKVTTTSRRLTEEGSTNTKGKENCCRKTAKYTAEGQEAQVQGFRWRRWRTSKRAWNLFTPTIPVLPLHQGPAASSKGPAASAISGEDSEYSDEYSAQSQDSGRTVRNPDLYVLTNDEHWAMTPEKHEYAAAARTFCVTTENMEINRTYAIWPLGRVYNDHCTSMKWSTTSAI